MSITTATIQSALNVAAPMTRPLIEIEHAGLIYQAESGPVEALRDISLTIHEGEFVALLGPSGCGKSTLMRAIAGLHNVTSGRILVDGAPVEKPIAKVGMVFQAALLLKWRTILDNVLLPVELAGGNPEQYRERAMSLLRMVGLGDFAGKRPRELSGACSSVRRCAVRSSWTRRFSSWTSLSAHSMR